MKSRICFSGLVLFAIFFAMVLFMTPAFAQEKVNFEDMGIKGELEGYEIVEPQTRPPQTQEFGLKDFSYTWIPACQFSQHGGTSLGIIDWAPGYYGRAAGTGLWFTAALDLPSGVDIHGIRIYLRDSHATEDIYGWYWRHNTDNNTLTEIHSFNTTDTPGYTTHWFDPWPNSIFDNYNTYIIRLRLDADNTSLLCFRGVRIAYLRKISDPPATATFSDVTPPMQFFPYIEALAAAGITTGYGDGTFRPDQVVTRGQMAAFLARALGLHHVEPWQ